MNMESVIEFIKKNPNDAGAIGARLLELARETGEAGMRNFFVRSGKVGLPVGDLVLDAAKVLIQNGLEDTARSICEKADESSPYYGFYRIGLALADFKNFDIESGAANLRAGLRGYVKNFDHVIPDSNAIIGNSCILDEMKWAVYDPWKKPSLQIFRDARFSDSLYTCFVTCTPDQFEDNADVFVKTLREHCGAVNIFMLLLNPNNEMIAKVSSIEGVVAAKYPHGLGGWKRKVRASVRLLYAGDVLRAMNEPVVLMDIDAAFPENSAEILSGIAQNDVTLYETGDLFPSSRISQTVIGSRPSEDAYSFWSAVGEVVLSGLSRQGLLMAELPGVALYAGACAGHDKGWNITFAVSAPEGVPFKGKEQPQRAPKYPLPDLPEEAAPFIPERPRRVESSVSRTDTSGQTPTRKAFKDMGKLFRFIKSNLGKYEAGDKEIYNEAIVNYALRADIPALRHFLDCCEAEGLSSAGISYMLLSALALAGEDNIISDLLAASNRSETLFGMFNVGQSFVECRKFESEACAYYLREGLYHCIKRNITFDYMRTAIQAAYLMEPVSRPDNEISLSFYASLIHRDVFKDSPYNLTTTSSPEYFNLFWDRRIKNIREVCGNVNVTITLFNPTDDIISRAMSHRGVSVNVAHYPSDKITSELMLAYAAPYNDEDYREMVGSPGKTGIYFEMDSDYPQGIHEIFSYMSQHSICYVPTRELYPTLMVDCTCQSGSLSYENVSFNKIFKDDRMGIISSKMGKGPLYLVDQLCRYKAIAWAKKKGYDMVDINEYTNGRWRYFFKQDGGELPLEKRKKMRATDKFNFKGMTEDRRCIFEKSQEQDTALHNRQAVAIKN
ncbi:hypothetical protein FACS1894216_11300 [Synergistales bacterium]|nr:hypothetical protein FACS1894216_11300 [Synergistales bacterium]